MAEINIQRKKKPVWPWVLALLIVLGLAAFLYFAFGNQTNNPISTSRQTKVSYTLPDSFQDKAHLINKMVIDRWCA